MACPCLSLVPVSRVLKERSISNSSGDIVHNELAELVVSGLEVFEDSCELLLDDVSDKDEVLSVPLVLVSSALELPDGGIGQRHRRLTSGGLRHRLQTGRMRVTG